MDVKFQIFISSTYQDLIEERESAIAAILKIGHIPIGMEMFKAEDVDSWEIIKRTIESADYYVVIVGHKYGSIAKNGKSFTEMEYDYAVKLGTPTLAFIIDDSAVRQANQIEESEEKRQKLNRFKKKLEKKNRDTWKDKSELSYKLVSALTSQFNITPRPGWIRKDRSYSSSIDELTRLSKENSELRGRILKLEEQTINEFRKPLLKVSFSEELTFEIKIPNSRRRTNNQPWSIYFRRHFSLDYAQLNAKRMVLSLNNIGTIKATLIDVEVIMPREMVIFHGILEEEDWDHSNKWLDKPSENIDDYEMHPGDVDVICGCDDDLDRLWDICTNCAKISLRTLLHTRGTEDTIMLLPLKKGEYNIEVRYICDEYPKKIIETIPVKVN